MQSPQEQRGGRARIHTSREPRHPADVLRRLLDVSSFLAPTGLQALLFEPTMNSELPTLLPVHNSAQPHWGLHLPHVP